MKKLNILLAGALALAMTACDDDTTYGIPQVNEEQPLVSADGVTCGLASGFENATALNLNDYVDAQIPVIDVAKTVIAPEANLPKDTKIEYELAISTSADLAGYQTIKMAADGSVSANDWEAVCQSYWKRDPNPGTMYVGVMLFATDANENTGLTQSARLGDADTFLHRKTLEVTPLDLKVCELNYYLLLNATTASEGIRMERKSDKHPYDDPTFTLQFTAPTAPAYWAIAGQGAYDADASVYECYGASGTNDTALEGTLSNEDGTQGMLTKAGTYVITVNMETLAYTIVAAYEELYTPGPLNGWNASAPEYTLRTKDFESYAGLVKVEDMFKLSRPDWSPNWGLDAWSGDAKTSGTLKNDGGNIEVASGLYCVNANIKALTFSLYEVTEIGLIGDFNGWGSSLNLTPNADKSVWTGEVTFTGANGYLFRFNNDWAHKIGCNTDGTTLLVDGENLTAPGAGTYTVTLDIKSSPMTVTFTAK